MIRWRHLLPWFLRAWPVLAFIPVGLVHATAHRIFVTDTVLVNKIAGMSLQILGGLLVLYSVNDNLGLFRAQSLKATMIAWFKDFPFVRRPIFMSFGGSLSDGFKASVSATVSSIGVTLEERITELERRLQELQNQLQREILNINSRIQTERAEFQQQIAAVSSNMTDLSKRLEHAAVGGFKLQALGVLLAIYGAITSVFA